MNNTGLLDRPTARPRGYITVLLVLIGLALLSIGANFLAVGMRMPDPDPMREPRLMVSISDTAQGFASQLKEIPGVAGVLPAREVDLESMYLSSDSGWHVGSTLVLLVEEGAKIGPLRDHLIELPGVSGYAERTDFGGTWRIGDNGGAWYDRRGWVVYLLPVLFAVPGIVLLWLAWKRRQASGGSAPVV